MQLAFDRSQYFYFLKYWIVGLSTDFCSSEIFRQTQHSLCLCEADCEKCYRNERDLIIQKEKHLTDVSSFLLCNNLLTLKPNHFIQQIIITKDLLKCNMCISELYNRCDVMYTCRYTAVAMPLLYNTRYSSRRRVALMIAVVWFLSFAISCPLLFGLSTTGIKHSSSHTLMYSNKKMNNKIQQPFNYIDTSLISIGL